MARVSVEEFQRGQQPQGARQLPQFDIAGTPMVATGARSSGVSFDAVGEIERKVRETEETKAAIKKEDFGKSLENFLLIDESIPRGKGLERFSEGITSSIEGFTRETGRGRSVASFDALKKRLRVQLVRAAGDVGNINIVEQEAAEKILPSIFDDEGTANIKRAVLRSILSGESQGVREALEQAGVKFKDKEEDALNNFKLK